MTEVTDEMIEAGAKAALLERYGVNSTVSWKNFTRTAKAVYLAMQAAAPDACDHEKLVSGNDGPWTCADCGAVDPPRPKYERKPIAPAAVADGERLREAASALLERMTSTYTARNGRRMGVQGDDGEMCWIVHSDDIEALRAALRPEAAASDQGEG